VNLLSVFFSDRGDDDADQTMHHVKQAGSRLVVHPMPVGARDMRHNFRGPKKKATGSVCAKNPYILRHLRHLHTLFFHESSIYTGLPNEKGEPSFVKQPCSPSRLRSRRRKMMDRSEG
jgi:hypothetical protein